MPTIPGLENINYGSLFTSLIFWIKIILYFVLMFVGMIIVYIYMTFNIKATVFPLYGSATDGRFSFSKKKWNRYRWIKKRTAWKPLLPILNKKEVEPFDQKFIYPGNQIIVFDYNDQMIPGQMKVNTTKVSVDGKERISISAQVNPVPHYIRNWQCLQHKKNAMEYAEHTWWQDNKALMISLMAGIAILVAVCVTVYFTYQFAGGGREDISILSNAINNFGNIPGKPPM